MSHKYELFFFFSRYLFVAFVQSKILLLPHSNIYLKFSRRSVYPLFETIKSKQFIQNPTSPVGAAGTALAITIIQDRFGLWTPRCGFRISGTRYRIPRQWNLSVSRILVSLIWIPDSKVQDSGKHKQKFPGAWYPDYLIWGPKTAPWSFLTS